MYDVNVSSAGCLGINLMLHVLARLVQSDMGHSVHAMNVCSALKQSATGLIVGT